MELLRLSTRLILDKFDRLLVCSTRLVNVEVSNGSEDRDGSKRAQSEEEEKHNQASAVFNRHDCMLVRAEADAV